MNNQLIIVSADDWEGVYYQGELIDEDHKIRRPKLVKLMKEYNTFDVVEMRLSLEGEECVRDCGCMPLSYDELIGHLL